MNIVLKKTSEEVFHNAYAWLELTDMFRTKAIEYIADKNLLRLAMLFNLSNTRLD